MNSAKQFNPRAGCTDENYVPVIAAIAITPPLSKRAKTSKKRCPSLEIINPSSRTVAKKKKLNGQQQW
jgi:hypothetical protein